jgi:hypothetical protein
MVQVPLPRARRSAGGDVVSGENWVLLAIAIGATEYLSLRAVLRFRATQKAAERAERRAAGGAK